MQNEQGTQPDHRATSDRLWVFRTGSSEALWTFLAWLNRYGHQIRRRAGEIHHRTVESDVTAIGTTVFVRLRALGAPSADAWPGGETRRWQQLEDQMIPWMESQACVACIQPASRRSHRASTPEATSTTEAESPGGGDAWEAVHSPPASSHHQGREISLLQGTDVNGEPRRVLGQTPASRMPRRVLAGEPWARVDDGEASRSSEGLDQGDGTESGATGRVPGCRRRLRRVSQRFAWRGHCGTTRARCRRRSQRLGLRPGLGCR